MSILKLFARLALSCLALTSFPAFSQIANGSFETPSIPNFEYGPGGATWTFDFGGGIQHNGSGWGATNAPDGVQTAFLQSTGYMAQSVNLSAGSYTISFVVAQRASDATPNPVRVMIDGVQIGSDVTPSSASFDTRSIQFSVSSGTHEVRLEGTHNDGTSSFVDLVSVQADSTDPLNASFETPVVSTFQYQPSAPNWTFSIGAGIQRTGWGAAPAPDGSQTAFIQGTASISESIVANDGGYVLTFYYANRPGYGVQPLSVLLDGTQMAVVTPPGTNFTQASVPLRIRTNGTHTIQLQGTQPEDKTTFVDAVSLRTSTLATCGAAIPAATTTYATSGAFRVTVYGVTNATNVVFHTWGEPGGQDDKILYPATNAGNGVWFVDVDLGNHKVGNPEYGKFTAHVYAMNSDGVDNHCSTAIWYRELPPPSSPSISSANGLAVTLDAQRGGHVGSITLNGMETIVDGSGRGMETSGLLFNESGGTGGPLWAESGCQFNYPNPFAPTFEQTASYLRGNTGRLVSWGSQTNPCETDGTFSAFQISHKVSFPSTTYKVVALEQILTNLITPTQSVTPTGTNYRVTADGYPDQYNWPFLPQLHLARGPFVDPTMNSPHWRVRQANGSWSTWDHLYPRDDWLDSRVDSMSSAGHAIAVYKDTAFSFGAALYCPSLDYGFYAKDMPTESIIMIVNSWSFNGGTIASNVAVSKTCYVIYGSETEITAAINELNGVSSTNVALASAGAVASASSEASTSFPVSAVINGDRTGAPWASGGGWKDATANAYPDWVQIDFAGTKTINRVVVYSIQDSPSAPIEPSDTMTFTSFGAVDFTVQGWTGSTWTTLGTVTGNNLVKRPVSFTPYSTNRIRINITNTPSGSTYSRLAEIEAWTP